MVQIMLRGGLIAVVFAVITLTFGLVWHNQSATARALSDHGVTATATVVDKETRTTRTRTDHGTRRSTSHHVTYAYDTVSASGARQSLRVEHSVPRRIYDSLGLNAQVAIRYLPETPSRAEVYPGEIEGAARMFGAFALISAVATAFSAWGTLALARRGRLTRVAPVHAPSDRAEVALI